MGFISFNLAYYGKKTEYYENKRLNAEEIAEAKRLLKLVEDLKDEGYDELFNALQSAFWGVDRLRAILNSYGEEPFKIKARVAGADEYKWETAELTEYLGGLIKRCEDVAGESKFADEVENFRDFIGYEEGASYVFLLRDALLPYVYYSKNNAKNLYPWLISRKFFDLVCNGAHIDDLIRSVIFAALERGYRDFRSFTDYCKGEISVIIERYPDVSATLGKLLADIRSEKIIVVETGCYGTFPMLLSALDDRVQFRMYTTVPYLAEIYKDIIYTERYENLREFETLCCNDKLFSLAGFKDGKFYVSENADEEVVGKSLGEIKSVAEKSHSKS